MRPAKVTWDEAIRAYVMSDNSITDAPGYAAATAIVEADRAELVADVFAYLIARSQEPEEFLPGSYVKRLHADERTAWLKKMQKEYNGRNP